MARARNLRNFIVDIDVIIVDVNVDVVVVVSLSAFQSQSIIVPPGTRFDALPETIPSQSIPEVRAQV